jgi:hypothetical protein
MKNNTRRLVAIVEIGLTLIMPISKVFADSDAGKNRFEEFESLPELTAGWWQWALSIPASQNPQLDATGEKGVLGQRGAVWFLAGVFGGVTATRTCSVPEDKALFFPVINDVEINTPNVCGSGPSNVSVKTLRATSAANINGAANLSVTVDGIVVKNLRRVQSDVFEVALPADSVFVAPCYPLPVPDGIYSPAVSDGYYVLLNPLRVGNHTIHFYGENPAGTPAQSVTYNLTVVKVLQK